MILEGIIRGFLGLIELLISFLPSFTPLDGDALATLAQVFSWVGWVNYYIPLDMAWQSILIVVGSWVPCALIHVFLELL